MTGLMENDCQANHPRLVFTMWMRKNGFIAMRHPLVFASVRSIEFKNPTVMKVPTMLRPRRGFTLIELLVVIAIIAVLAAAGFAVGTAALNRARKVSAQATATSVAQAVDLFFSEYGMFPVASGSGNIIDTESNTTFLEALIGQNETLNPRGVRFLSVKEGKRDGTGGVDGLVYEEGDEAGDTVRGLYDPWGNPYTVILDTDYSERLSFSVSSDGKIIGGDAITVNGRRVAVLSPGVQPGEDSTASDWVKTW